MNAGIMNGNFRNGHYLELANQIKADALNPDIVHPREVKLAQLRELMGTEKYAAWYERNRGLNVAKWEAAIDAELEALKPAPLMVEVMQAQLDKIMSDLGEPMSRETAAELMTQAVDLQAAIEREHGAIDSRYDAIICAKHGASL